MQAYFLAATRCPGMCWHLNRVGMFDISGTMLLVYWMFIYGLKSVWIPGSGPLSTRFS